MMLSGREIHKEVGLGNIYISPYDESRLNPNSYNLRLADKLLVYKRDNYHRHPNNPGELFNVLDMKKELEVEEIIIPKDGFILMPGTLYLGRTLEWTETKKYVPMLEGRSSVGRLGVFIHATAGFGDVGFSGTWTLEISCVEPVRIYPHIEIGQIYFHEIKGWYDLYKGKYQNSEDVGKSRIYQDFE